MSRLRILALLPVLLLGGPAAAQSVPAPPPAEKASDVPDPRKLERSAKALGTMREVLRVVEEKLEEAKRSKDVLKFKCVTDKLTTIKGLLKISERVDLELQAAVARKNTLDAEGAYDKVMVTQQSVVQLRAEAEECIGQLAFRTDENLLVEVDEPKDLPGGDPTRPLPPVDIPIRPPPASPTL